MKSLNSDLFTEFIEKRIPYKNAEAFIRENPNWFKGLVPSNGFFGDDGPAPTFFDRLSGCYSYGVRVSYIEKRLKAPIRKNGTKGAWKSDNRHLTGLVSYGNCGQVYIYED